MQVELRVMLISVSDQKAGIAFYVHGRKFAHVGWDNPQSRYLFNRVPRQNQIKHVRVEVDFDGPIDDVPISANKDEVNMNGVLAIVGKIARKVVDPYFKAYLFWRKRGPIRSNKRSSLSPVSLRIQSISGGFSRQRRSQKKRRPTSKHLRLGWSLP